MTFKEFIDISISTWNDYFRVLAFQVKHALLRAEDARTGLVYPVAGRLLFPTTALLTRLNDYFICEFFGAAPTFTELEVKFHEETSVLKYLYQFPPPEDNSPAYKLNGSGSGLINLKLSPHLVDEEVMGHRFSFLDQWPTTIRRVDGKGSLISFGDNFESCYFDDCLLVNTCQQIHRVKHISHMIVVSKAYKPESYREELQSRLRDCIQSTHNKFLGTKFCRGTGDLVSVLAGQFANVFLLPGLRETTLGDFLRNNPLILQRAFSCTGALHEPQFDWVEGDPSHNERSIRPDVMLRRVDGYYDICDLKTAALDRPRLTKGKHRRRRFIDYVYEGVAQLANYEDYFSYEMNRQFARSHCGVEIDNPELILIVGTFENANVYEIQEASRQLKPNYRIIDYDTVNALFVKPTGDGYI